VTNDSDSRGRFGFSISLRYLNSGPPKTGTTPHSSFSPNSISRTHQNVISVDRIITCFFSSVGPLQVLYLVDLPSLLSISSVEAFQNERPLVTAVLGSAHWFSRIPGYPVRNMEPMTQHWSEIICSRPESVGTTRKALVTLLNPICISLNTWVTRGLPCTHYSNSCKREVEQEQYDFLCQRCQPGPNGSFKHALMTSRMPSTFPGVD